MPNVATFTEQGFPGFDLDSWIGVYAPAKTPQPIVDAMDQRAARDHRACRTCRSASRSSASSRWATRRREFIANYKADYPRVADLIKAAGVSAE